MAVYDGRQMNSMRQDAIRRSREMYGRQPADITVGHDNTVITGDNHIKGKQSDKSGKNQEFTQHETVQHSVRRKGNELNELLGKIIGGNLDSDKLIIIALMIMLAREGADLKLLLALGYILI